MRQSTNATNDESINNVMRTVSNETKSQFKEKESAIIKTRNSKKNKNLRDARRIQVKDRTIVPTNRDWFKNEYKDSYDV